MSEPKLHPLKLSPEQIALRDIAVQQIGELLATLQRLDAITGKQADTEVISDIRHDLKNHIDLFGQWFGTSPVEE
ncbi:MAG: hypothetical protein O2856_06005 [Planctomycetota bacterium]|nr:hypothetical protein [Planctomycetota bacterium]